MLIEQAEGLIFVLIVSLIAAICNIMRTGWEKDMLKGKLIAAEFELATVEETLLTIEDKLHADYDGSISICQCGHRECFHSFSLTYRGCNEKECRCLNFIKLEKASG